MALSPGTRLGHYDVTALIGEGGMGQVWQATDTQLNRQVALKILPDAFADDPDRLARFQREAQVLASLNHPNIAAIYGIEEAEGTRALVLELVEGPTLADRIGNGAIPVDEALPIAKQIAEALEAAHEAGVIHRDLKPANIKVREDGTVKVLDFGLAKAFQPDGSDPNMSLSPTISLTAAATQMGMVIGTAAYMAPEQAKGRAVDKRADVWAFGAVLYEMLTGQKPFSGDDLSTTLARVIEREPDWDLLPSTLSPSLAVFLRRCLAKDPRQRVHDVADVRLAMEGAFETTLSAPSAAAAVAPRRLWQRPVPALIGLLLVAVIAGFTVWVLTRPVPPAPTPVAQFALPTPSGGAVRTEGLEAAVAISPDGTRVVYASGRAGPANWRLYLRQLGDLDAIPLRGTEGATAPFFSADGQWVGFRGSNPGRLLKKVPVLGGPAVTIAPMDAQGLGMSWGPDDTIVFATTDGLRRVSAAGGEPEMLTTVEPGQENEAGPRWPSVLPNGKGVLFTAWSGSVETSRLAVLSLETRQVTYLLTGGSDPRYSPTGHIVYVADGTLFAVGFDADRLVLTTTNPVPVAENVNTRVGGAADFALADNGSLVYVTAVDEARALVWVDHEGHEEPLATPLRAYRVPSVSPSGTQVAVDVIVQSGADIWIHDLGRGTESRLTTGRSNDYAPLWTPDGERVVFTSNRAGPLGLFQKVVEAPGDADRLMTLSGDATVIQATSWSADGQTLLNWQVTGTRETDIGLLSLAGDHTPELLLDAEFAEATPAISPGGDWIAYESNETEQRQVYVQRFPALGGKTPISTDGGGQPLWSADGRELFYRAEGGGVVAVPVLATEPAFLAGNPEVLFDSPYYLGGSMRTYDLAPDGRFLMVKEEAVTDDSGTSSQPQIILVENWAQELLERVPVE